MMTSLLFFLLIKMLSIQGLPMAKSLLIILFPTIFFTIWKMVTANSHILMILLFLEILMLGILAFLVLIPSSTMNNTFFMSYFTLAVCEASFGLGLLIRMARQQKKFFLMLSSYFLKLM